MAPGVSVGPNCSTGSGSPAPCPLLITYYAFFRITFTNCITGSIDRPASATRRIKISSCGGSMIFFSTKSSKSSVIVASCSKAGLCSGCLLWSDDFVYWITVYHGASNASAWATCAVPKANYVISARLKPVENTPWAAFWRKELRVRFSICGASLFAASPNYLSMWFSIVLRWLSPTFLNPIAISSGSLFCIFWIWGRACLFTLSRMLTLLGFYCLYFWFGALFFF